MVLNDRHLSYEQYLDELPIFNAEESTSNSSSSGHLQRFILDIKNDLAPFTNGMNKHTTTEEDAEQWEWVAYQILPVRIRCWCVHSTQLPQSTHTHLHGSLIKHSKTAIAARNNRRQTLLKLQDLQKQLALHLQLLLLRLQHPKQKVNCSTVPWSGVALVPYGHARFCITCVDTLLAMGVGCLICRRFSVFLIY